MANLNEEVNSNLDLLRACAVSCVVLSHLILLFQIALPGPFVLHSIGLWGVLVFFVHTSLVLNLSLDRNQRRAPGVGLFWPFVIQRVFRIFPLSVFTVLLVVGAALPVGRIEHGHFASAQLTSLDVLSNLLLVQDITRSESVVVPLWSLPYEMQMYLLLPALFVLANSTRTVVPMLLVWAIAMVPLLRPWFFHRHGVPDFVEYIVYFIPGVVAYKLMLGRRPRLPAMLWPPALIGIALLFLESPTPVRGGICCLVLGLSIPHFTQISHPVVCRISYKVARYSYGIYLTHCISMWWAFQGLTGLPNTARWVVFLVTLGLVPVLLYHAIEAPMLQLGRRVAKISGSETLPQTPMPAKAEDIRGDRR
jgi:peptidoglycan/LPS O-acetylase OafA/YrhL